MAMFTAVYIDYDSEDDSGNPIIVTQSISAPDRRRALWYAGTMASDTGLTIARVVCD